ncbi:hypothetical protein EVAR_80364_1 [Eumeta japonica]|uniref:Uncharacterized protein n=1 Tax=Eumeta variegata TaxID=151549 RepID=A0A4C1X0K2_EUMVA|nr:hypothetical protein EVAR_80364_1 [Eumeta japonica]
MENVTPGLPVNGGLKRALKSLPLAATIDDFRKLNSLFIKSNLPFHTYALEEERKVKAVFKKYDRARDIFKKVSDVCGLSGIIIEAPYRRGKHGQCHCYQLCSLAAANCHTKPLCVRSHARAFQSKVKASMKEVRNENWSDLMVEISPSHQAYWGLSKALKTEGAVPTRVLRKPDKSVAFDDREKSWVFS